MGPWGDSRLGPGQGDSARAHCVRNLGLPEGRLLWRSEVGEEVTPRSQDAIMRISPRCGWRAVINGGLQSGCAANHSPRRHRVCESAALSDVGHQQSSHGPLGQLRPHEAAVRSF